MEILEVKAVGEGCQGRGDLSRIDEVDRRRVENALVH